MDILNFISWIKGGRRVTTVDPNKTLIPLGLRDARRDDDYLVASMSVADLATQISSGNVQSVNTPLFPNPVLTVNNTDPQNPVINFVGVYTDGTTVTGNGTSASPLIAAGSSLPAWLEFNAIDLTIWNNGKGNISGNTSYGQSALSTNTTGNNNTAYGLRALRFNTTGSSNTAIGIGSLRSNNTGFDNVAIGSDTLANNTTGQQNVAIGRNSLITNTVGFGNTAVGYSALNDNNTGNSNVALGQFALLQNTTGFSNVGIGTGTLANMISGNNNTAVGHVALAGNFDGCLVLGSGATATGNNQFVVGSSSANAGTVTNAAAVQSHYWTVKINGTDYKILLST